ncbi:hypothetical protein F4808DRAFT_475482 [Astrocystis sublimbata]|nr:hypothetical protein F4808DRAFT_475482 [Astrocystis sublimbata]
MSANPEAKTKTYVFLTGNAPYRENKHNTSRMIRDATPSLITRPGKQDIVVLKYRRDSLDVYADVLEMAEEVWAARRSSFLPPHRPDTLRSRESADGNEDEIVDLAFGVHLGMTTAVPGFRAEKIAYREGYQRPGEDGVYVDEAHFRNLGLPESLKPCFDNDAAVAEVRGKFENLPIRADDHPNQGFCEYRLYASLAQLHLKHPSKRGRAVFLHVPKDQSPEAIRVGADVVEAYIIALVEQLEKAES